MQSLPLIAITMGDPAGVGPEIIVKALQDKTLRQTAKLLVLGDRLVMERAVAVCGSSLQITEIDQPEEAFNLGAATLPLLPLSSLTATDMAYGHPSEKAGDGVYRYIRQGAEFCLAGRVDAMATAPISKEAMNNAGHLYHGHTELLAELCCCDDYVMMLAGDLLRVALVTIHEPLSAVPAMITTEQVLKTIRVTAAGVIPLCGQNKPRIAVLSLNPHCGEGGMFGNEEADYIIPAIEAAKAEGIQVEGPFSADTFFHFATKKDSPWDAVVAMYHDQGLIPLKMLHFDDGINITLGLPIIRTSVDHGTAYNLAGTAQAADTSMKAAIRTAIKLASSFRMETK